MGSLVLRSGLLTVVLETGKAVLVAVFLYGSFDKGSIVGTFIPY